MTYHLTQSPTALQLQWLSCHLLHNHHCSIRSRWQLSTFVLSPFEHYKNSTQTELRYAIPRTLSSRRSFCCINNQGRNPSSVDLVSTIPIRGSGLLWGSIWCDVNGMAFVNLLCPFREPPSPFCISPWLKCRGESRWWLLITDQCVFDFIMKSRSKETLEKSCQIPFNHLKFWAEIKYRAVEEHGSSISTTFHVFQQYQLSLQRASGAYFVSSLYIIYFVNYLSPYFPHWNVASGIAGTMNSRILLIWWILIILSEVFRLLNICCLDFWIEGTSYIGWRFVWSCCSFASFTHGLL